MRQLMSTAKATLLPTDVYTARQGTFRDRNRQKNSIGSDMSRAGELLRNSLQIGPRLDDNPIKSLD
jgi:hypothetical protein